LAKSREFGTDELVDISTVSNPVEAVRSLTPGGRGVDVAIEAVGLPETWEQATAMTRPGGLANLFGGCKSGTHVKIDTRRLHYDELEIIGVFHHTPRYVRAALSLISSRQLDADALITHEMPLERLEEALQLVAGGEALKVAIIP
jgi:L-iditol 2-dehydrogenase